MNFFSGFKKQKIDSIEKYEEKVQELIDNLENIPELDEKIYSEINSNVLILLKETFKTSRENEFKIAKLISKICIFDDLFSQESKLNLFCNGLSLISEGFSSLDDEFIVNIIEIIIKTVNLLQKDKKIINKLKNSLIAFLNKAEDSNEVFTSIIMKIICKKDEIENVLFNKIVTFIIQITNEINYSYTAKSFHLLFDKRLFETNSIGKSAALIMIDKDERAFSVLNEVITIENFSNYQNLFRAMITEKCFNTERFVASKLFDKLLCFASDNLDVFKFMIEMFPKYSIRCNETQKINEFLLSEMQKRSSKKDLRPIKDAILQTLLTSSEIHKYDLFKFIVEKIGTFDNEHVDFLLNSINIPIYDPMFVDIIDSIQMYEKLSQLAYDKRMPKEVLSFLCCLLMNESVAKNLIFVKKDKLMKLATAALEINCTKDFIELATTNKEIRFTTAISLLLERSKKSNTEIEVMKELTTLAMESEVNVEKEYEVGVFDYALEIFSKCKNDDGYLRESIRLISELAKVHFPVKSFASLINVIKDGTYPFPDEVFNLFNTIYEAKNASNAKKWSFMFGSDIGGIHDEKISISRKEICLQTHMKINKIKDNFCYPFIILKMKKEITFSFEKENRVISLKLKYNNKNYVFTCDEFKEKSWFTITFDITPDKVEIMVNEKTFDLLKAESYKSDQYINFDNKFDISIASYKDLSAKSLMCNMESFFIFDTKQTTYIDDEPMTLQEDIAKHVIRVYNPRFANEGILYNICKDPSKTVNVSATINSPLTNPMDTITNINCVFDCIPTIAQLKDKKISIDRSKRMLVSFFKFIRSVLSTKENISLTEESKSHKDLMIRKDNLCKEFNKTDNFKTISCILYHIDLDYITDDVFNEVIEIIKTSNVTKIASAFFLNYDFVFRQRDVIKYINEYAKRAFAISKSVFFDKEALIPFLKGTYSEIKNALDENNPRTLEEVITVLDFAYSIIKDKDFHEDKSFILSYAMFNDDLTTKKIAIQMMRTNKINVYSCIDSQLSLLPWEFLIRTKDVDIQKTALDQMFSYMKGSLDNESIKRTSMRSALLLNKIENTLESLINSEETRNYLISYSATIPLILKMMSYETSEESINNNSEWLRNKLESDEKVRKAFLDCEFWYIHLLQYCYTTNNINEDYFCSLFKEKFNDFNNVLDAIKLINYEDFNVLQKRIIQKMCSEEFFQPEKLNYILKELVMIIFFDTKITKEGIINDSTNIIHENIKRSFPWLWNKPHIEISKKQDIKSNEDLIKLALTLIKSCTGGTVTIFGKKIEVIHIFTDLFCEYLNINAEDALEYLPDLYEKITYSLRGSVLIATANIKKALEDNGKEVPLDIIDMTSETVKPRNVIYERIYSENIADKMQETLLRERSNIVNAFQRTVIACDRLYKREHTISDVFEFLEVADYKSTGHYWNIFNNASNEIGSDNIKRMMEEGLEILFSRGGIWNNQNNAFFAVSSFVNKRGGRVLMKKSTKTQFEENVKQIWSIPVQNVQHKAKDGYESSANAVEISGIYNGKVDVNNQSITFEGHTEVRKILFNEEILLSYVEFVFKRRYVLEDIACEIYSVFSPPLFLVFPTTSDRDDFMSFVNAAVEKNSDSKLRSKHKKSNKGTSQYISAPCYPESKFDLMRRLRKICRGVCQNKSDVELLKGSDITIKWNNHEMSTFEYISYLNIFGGRSYNNLSSYPVMPWIVKEYEKSFDEIRANKNSFREFNKLMINMNSNSWENSNLYCNVPQNKFINPTKVSTMNARQSPYYQMMISLKDSIFTSVKDLFELSYTQEHHELTPEWYCVPTFLVNPNNYMKENDNNLIDVELPEWSKTDLDNPIAKALRFIELHRSLLESQNVSDNINKWIDIIFGKDRKNPNVGNIGNEIVCPEYNPQPEEEEIRKENACNVLTCMNNLFDIEHIKRNETKRDKVTDFDPQKTFAELQEPTKEQVEMFKNMNQKLACISKGHKIAVFIGNKDHETSYATVLFMNNAQQKRFICNKSANITCACISGERLLITGGSDGSVYIWSLPALSLCKELTWHYTKVVKVACSVDANLLVTADNDNNVIIQSIDGTFINSVSGVTPEIAILVFKNGFISVVEEKRVSMFSCVGVLVSKMDYSFSILEAHKFVSSEYRNYIAVKCEENEEISFKLIDITTLESI